MSEYGTINLGEFIRSGEGGTAVSYKHKSRNTLAKLYNPGFEADTARLRSYKETMRQFYLEKDLVPEDYQHAALTID